MARSKVLVAVYLVLAAAIAVVGGLLAYTSTLQQSSQQPTQVTWQDASGNPITSLSLRSNAQGPTSQTISFKCNPSVGHVTLSTSSNFGSTLTLSHSDFVLCGSSPNTVIITASPDSPSSSGTLQVLQPDIYKSLSGTLTINIQ
ncbi:MAG: hypothetical protein AUJ07_01570 [Crenarchaeota archaeon 13_1_40CM_3_53_5]|nr:MAG: hypothetical protein AUJ07_01570 [Crenarchaeota archaeon 13_1_40CM_3_53_5]